MLYYRCSHCGKRVARGEKCGCGFKREYTPITGTRKLYKTYRWMRLRDTIYARYNYLDAFALANGRIETAVNVHHIIPAEEDIEQFWNPDNLIPLSRCSHDLVHVAYRESPEAKAKMQEFLRSLIKPVGESVL